MSDTKIKTSNIGNLAVTHALLHTDMDLTSKTVQVAAPSSNTHPATKLYVDTEVANLIDSAPGTLDTLNELAAAVNDDANFNATIASSIATKLPLAGGTLTGNLTLASTASGSSASPEFELRRDITGADANYIGQIKFTADNDADQNTVFAKITGKILDASDGTEDGIIEFAHKKAGSNNISARFRSDSLQLINGTNLTVAGTTELTGNVYVGGASQIDSSTLSVYGNQGISTTRTGSSSFIKMLVGSSGESRIDTANASRVMEVPSSGSEVVFNKGSLDRDFRVESNNNANMLFVDAGNDRISVGSGSTYSMFNVISSNDNTSDWWTNSVATQYIQNTVGHPVLKMNNNNSNRSAYVVYNGNGSAQGFHIFDRQNEQSRISAYTSSVVINEAGTDVDFRVESDSKTHALFVEGAGANANQLRIGMGTGTITNPYAQTNFTDLNIDGVWGGVISFKLGGTEYGWIGQRNSGNGDMIVASSSGQSLFLASNGNTARIELTDAGNVVINPTGADNDFRVESNGISNMLLVDAGEDVVKIGTTAGVQTAGNGDARLIVGNGIEIIQDLAANSLNKDMLRLSTAGSWSNVGNSGYYSDITWDNGGTNTMGRIGLRFGGTTTGGQSEFTIRDMYQGGFGNSGNIAHFGSNKSVILEGSLKVGKTSADDTLGGVNFETHANAEAFAFTHTHGSDNSGWSVMINRQNSVGKVLEFRKANTNVGSISVSSSGTTYNTTSDRRLKDNIQPISDATDKLMNMKPVTHTWIDNPDEPQVHGFIAQEMQDVIPEAVSGDAESDEMMSMDYGRITPVIVAALQDALKEIKELKTRIDELENN